MRVFKFKAYLLLCTLLVFAGNTASQAKSCPDTLKQAKQLILVTTRSMNTSSGTLTRFIWNERKSIWQSTDNKHPITLGKRGIAWSWTYSQYKKKNEPQKKEGDGKTPAGFFTIGKSFGFKKKTATNYISLKRNEHICVDDPKSKYYNQIIRQSKVKQKLRGENMGAIKLYKHGIIINYPEKRSIKSGSCIFIHIWKSPKSPTLGCIAMPQSKILQLQEHIKNKITVIGILPKTALHKFTTCLPGVQLTEL